MYVHKKIFLSNISIATGILMLSLCLSPVVANAADTAISFQLSVRDAGIIAGIAVGIGIVIGSMRGSKRTDIKSAPTDAHETAREAYFVPEHQKKEEMFASHPLEVHITILNFEF